MPSELRQQLVEVLREKGLKHLPAPVELASGEMSDIFLDGKEALGHWRDLRTACEAIVETVHDAGVSFDAVGGPTLGADALAVGIAAAADCQWFFIRKEPKARGTRRLIEGTQIGPGNRVLLIEDVVTTGGSILKAHGDITDTGAVVVAASTLVDRSDRAAATFADLGVPYFPMASFADLGIEPVAASPDQSN